MFSFKLDYLLVELELTCDFFINIKYFKIPQHRTGLSTSVSIKDIPTSMQPSKVRTINTTRSQLYY
jgi:hypothetical protein